VSRLYSLHRLANHKKQKSAFSLCFVSLFPVTHSIFSIEWLRESLSSIMPELQRSLRLGCMLDFNRSLDVHLSSRVHTILPFSLFSDRHSWGGYACSETSRTHTPLLTPLPSSDSILRLDDMCVLKPLPARMSFSPTHSRTHHVYFLYMCPFIYFPVDSQQKGSPSATLTGIFNRLRRVARSRSTSTSLTRLLRINLPPT